MRFPVRSRLLRLMAFSVLFSLLVFTLMRLVFWEVYHLPGDPMSSGIFLKAMYTGFKFDLRLALLINFPLFAFSWVKWINPFETVAGRRLWAGFLVAANMAVMFFYVVDFGHYGYLQSRLNASALRFLKNPLISFRMVWETYPVIWGTLGLLLFSLLLWYGAGRLILRISSGRPAQAARWKKALTMTLATLLILFGIYGKFSYYPLRWADAFFSPHPFSSELALNPMLYFFDTLKNREKAFDEEETRRHYGVMAEYLGLPQRDGERLDYSRFVDAPQAGSSRPNVVMVILESFAFYKIGAFGNPLDPTPNFDSLAKDSLFFRRFYVPSAGTARAVFSTVTGIPDVEAHQTYTRNPLVVEQHTIINAFKGYEKFYFLGGSANWANIRGLLSRNIEGLRIYEEGSFSSPRADVWGISDLHLFEEANNVLRELEKPFFAIIHTSGNHRPYTIPKDNRGFRAVEAEDDELRKYGFISEAEFNSFRFMDHSIGFFMETARKERYFRNTVFVFFGDHGLPGNAGHIHKAEERLLLTRYHVPLLIYAPGMIDRGRALDKPAGQLDVLPTIAALTSTPYLNTTLGKDLMDSRLDSMRYAFTVTDQSAMPQIGILDDGFYFLMNVDGTNRRLHEYYSDSPRKNVLEKHPERAARMELVCRGIYETSKYMAYHNKPGEHAPPGE